MTDSLLGYVLCWNVNKFAAINLFPLFLYSRPKHINFNITASQSFYGRTIGIYDQKYDNAYLATRRQLETSVSKIWRQKCDFFVADKPQVIRTMVLCRKHRDIFHHRCQLPKNPHEFAPEIAPFAPLHKRIRRYLKMSVIVSESTPRVSVYYSSRAAVQKEQKSHFYSSENQYVIHPFSKIARIREHFVPFVWFSSLVLQPFMATFYFYMIKVRVAEASQIRAMENIHDHFQWTVNGLICLDLLFNFRLGYCVPKFRIVIMDKWGIAKQYLKTYFICDFMCVVEGIVSFAIFQIPPHARVLLFQLIWFRLPRSISMIEYFEEILKKYGIDEAKISMFKLFLWTMLIMHWWACILVLMPTLRLYWGMDITDSWMYQLYVAQAEGEKMAFSTYPSCLLYTIFHFFGVGPKILVSEHWPEQIILSLILMSGFCYYLFVASKLLQFFGISNIAEAKYEEFCHVINEYTVMKKFPQDLRTRLNLYYEHKFRKKLFWENTILSSLSQHLRFEVILHNCSNLIKRVVLFQNLPKSAVGSILVKLQAEVYLANDMILSHDSISDTIFFITFGTVATFSTTTGNEMFHLEDGNHFGDVHIHLRSTGQTPYYSVIAAETTEIYTIERKYMKRCVQDIEGFSGLLEESSNARIQLYHKAILKDKQGTTHEDILTELSKKRILEVAPAREYF